MASSHSNESVMFDPRTLRLIVGALAFAFPTMVIALTGKITTSISASYYEPQARNVFVGFLFIIGALLIGYKGHRVRAGRTHGKVWSFLKRYQEDWISTIGGVAAILTALNPTACKGCSMDTKAVIHMSGAFVLFATVVYFCLIAFLRSVNGKLVHKQDAFAGHAEAVRSIRSLGDVHSLRDLGYLLLPEIFVFLRIAAQVRRDYDENGPEPGALEPTDPPHPGKLLYMWLAYGKKVTRGYVYLVCGLVIAVTLVSFLLILLLTPHTAADSKLTFLIETISLLFFGAAWMTASQLEYLRKIQRWLRAEEMEQLTVTQAGAAIITEQE